MPNVSDFIDSSVFLDNFNLCLDVVFTHLSPGEVPEFALTRAVWVVLLVLPTIRRASRIAKPHIIAFISKNKRRCLLSMRHYPTVGRVHKSVLEENNRLCRAINILLSLFCKFLVPDPENFKNIPVNCDSLMLFEQVTLLISNLRSIEFECLVGPVAPSNCMWVTLRITFVRLQVSWELCL